MMRKKEIREELIEKVKKVLNKTKIRVRMGGKLSKGFWTARRVKQGCPLSLLLFNILQPDIEEEMEECRE